MNLYELVSQTLIQGRLNATNAVKRSKYQNSLIVPALNDAYRKMCREKIHPWYTEAVTLDANKCFSVSSLTKTFVKILKISPYQDYSSSAGGVESVTLTWDKYDGAGTIVVPMAEASGTVYVEYEYMPTMLGITYNISGAETDKTIPVDEAISETEAAALAGQTLYIIDVSTGLYYEYTIDEATAGAAGAATITVNETISVSVADGDEIYIGDNWTPVIDEQWHYILTYWATSRYFRSNGPNYGDWANDWEQSFYNEFGYVTDDYGETDELKGAYRPSIL